MADWCSLPEELLVLISLRLSTSTDILRFRSVCSTWRSSADPPPSSKCYHILPQSQVFKKYWGFCLTKRTIYALRSMTPRVSSSWITKLERDNDNNRLLLFNPLTQSRLPETFHNSFDLWNFGIKELGQEYTLHHITFGTSANSVSMTGDILKEKVAVLNNNSAGDDFVILTIHEESRNLVVYKSGDKNWRLIQEHYVQKEFLRYDDVILRGGRFYAVDNTGRLVLVNHVDFNVTTVANPIFGGDKKFLIDSDGELFLVGRYLRRYGTNKACHRKLKVFRLDENVGNWIEISDLRDKMLFLGDNCTFGASVYDIFGDDHDNREGNHIFFMDRGLMMFDIKTRSSDPIGSRSYLKLFRPPTCLVNPAAPIEEGMNHISI